LVDAYTISSGSGGGEVLNWHHWVGQNVGEVDIALGIGLDWSLSPGILNIAVANKIGTSKNFIITCTSNLFLCTHLKNG
jgi:hypothetical protein